MPIRFAYRLLPALCLAALATAAAQAKPPSQDYKTYDTLPTEMPASLADSPASAHTDFIRREVMIPMRDGVKLFTEILIPKGVKDAPMLMTRTPYNAKHLTHCKNSGHLAEVISCSDNLTRIITEDKYIRVIQDVRGKYGSQGDYIMNRPMRGPQNPTPVDDGTDTYDTIAWLVKHVPQSNGNVGIYGVSYNGFESLVPMLDPNPHLKVVVPMNPMVDGWMGDDWFHHGAFREVGMSYIYGQESTRSSGSKWWRNSYDDYSEFLDAGSVQAMAKAHGMDQMGFWRKIVAHPAYDAFWQQQAMDKLIGARPLAVPTMLVSSLWDQEDIYGAMAVYEALKNKPSARNKLFLVMGPWHHGGEIGDGSTLGALKFPTDTGADFREHILRPFLAHYLKDGHPADHTAPVTAYQTGADRWERLDSWPQGCASGCSIEHKPLYLQADNGLGFSAPSGRAAASDSYVSDPARPVPYLQRPVRGEGNTWRNWLVTDQRFASSRTDVLTYETPVLKQAVTIAGAPIAHLVAATTGSDADWVVKLIDVYPDQVARQPEMGGYQLAVAMDILRGRYRTSYAQPQAITPNVPLNYQFPLPNVNHVFEPGHRIMVQVQSSWYPLYDRNPQTYVKNIFKARPSDFHKATMTIYHAPGKRSYVDLPVVSP